MRAIVFLLLSGCATLDCPQATINIYTRNGQAIYVLDEENMLLLAAAMMGLHEGTCKLAKPVKEPDA